MSVAVQRPDGSAIRVVVLRGCSGDPLPPDIARTVAPGGQSGPTIIDLSEVTILGPEIDEVVRRVVALVRAQPYCVVAHRRVARTACRRFGVGATAALFATVADALQAHRYACDGYGPGWAPATSAGGSGRTGARAHRGTG
ncbi:MAG: hypothetical protein S0880_05565 [Actinomycetota bacterium]|nr:hypothetical protein [Actinomycetota bacterium]